MRTDSTAGRVRSLPAVLVPVQSGSVVWKPQAGVAPGRHPPLAPCSRRGQVAGLHPDTQRDQALQERAEPVIIELLLRTRQVAKEKSHVKHSKNTRRKEIGGKP